MDVTEIVDVCAAGREGAARQPKRPVVYILAGRHSWTNSTIGGEIVPKKAHRRQALLERTTSLAARCRGSQAHDYINVSMKYLSCGKPFHPGFTSQYRRHKGSFQRHLNYVLPRNRAQCRARTRRNLTSSPSTSHPHGFSHQLILFHS